MFYRIMADLLFSEEDEAKDFHHDCLVALPKTATINPGQPNMEKSTLSAHLCKHEEDEICVMEELPW